MPFIVLEPQCPKGSEPMQRSHMDTNIDGEPGKSYLIELQPVPGCETAAYRDGVLDLQYPGKSNALVSGKKLVQLIQDQYIELPGKTLPGGAGFCFRMVKSDPLLDSEIEQLVEEKTIYSPSQIDGFHPKKQIIEQLIEYNITMRALNKSGFKKVSSGETRLSAIMFTDIVGYTPLMREDEQKALQLLDRNRTLHKFVIKEFGGTMQKEIGDGVLASFPSAGQAVRCATRIQIRLKDDPGLTLRIGIHIGDVVFKGGDLFGDSVNIAKRIESCAAPGGICVSGGVYEQIRNKPDMKIEFLRTEVLKGIKTPIEIYVIHAPSLPVPK